MRDGREGNLPPAPHARLSTYNFTFPYGPLDFPADVRPGGEQFDQLVRDQRCENLVLTGAAAVPGAGNALDNVITGNSSATTLFGLDGADRLDGGLGADTLQGGAPADTYVFSSALGAGNIDTIVNFNVADDTIELDSAVFTGLAAGALDPGAFHTGAAATDAGHRVIYDSATGQLFFDTDGLGGADQILFATLAPGLALTSSDFIIAGP